MQPGHARLVDGRTSEELLRIAEEASASLRSPGSKAALEHLEDRYDELGVATQWFIDQQRTDEALRITNALYRFWITKQRFEEGALRFDRVLEALYLGALGGKLILAALNANLIDSEGFVVLRDGIERL